MKKIPKNFEIELSILRIFLKHVKMHHLYNQFRCSVNVQNRQRDLFHTIASRVFNRYNDSVGKLGMIGSCYVSSTSLNDFLRIMRESCGGRILVENNNKGQMQLMNIVNNLIHSCIEYSVGDRFTILEQIGEGVFKEVCQTLFGDDFVDKTMEGLDQKQLEMLERHGRMMPPPMMGRGRRRGNDPQVEDEFRRWLDSMRDMMPQMPPQNENWNGTPQNPTEPLPWIDDFDDDDWGD